MSIWSNLRKAKGVPDLERQRAELAATIDGSEAEITRLRGKLTTGAFDDAKFDPKALGTQIRETSDELEALRGVLAGVDAELTAAREREAAAALEALHADARKAQAELRDAQVQCHDALIAIAKVLTAERDGRAKLEALNKRLVEAGREKVPAPLAVLFKGDHAEWEARMARDNRTPVNAPYTPDVLREIALAPYYSTNPHAPMDAESSPLARLKALKL
jgi:chromosome segregation ATPase